MDCKQFNFKIESNLGKSYENMDQDFIEHITSCQICREVFEDHNCMHDLLISSKSFLAGDFNETAGKTEIKSSSLFSFAAKAAIVVLAFFAAYFINYQITISSINQKTIASGTKIPDQVSIEVKIKKNDEFKISFAKTLIESEINKNIDDIGKSVEHILSNNKIASSNNIDKKYRNLDIELLPEIYSKHEKINPVDKSLHAKIKTPDIIPVLIQKKPEIIAMINGKTITTVKSIDVKSILKNSDSEYIVFKNNSKDTIFVDNNGVIYSPEKEYRIDPEYFAVIQFKTVKSNTIDSITMKQYESVIKTVFQTEAGALTMFNSENYYRLVLGDLGSENLIGHVQAKASLIEAEKNYDIQIKALPTKYSLKSGWNMIINPYHNPIKISDLLITYNGKESDLFSRKDLVLEYALVLKKSIFSLVSDTLIFPYEAIMIYSYVEASCTIPEPENKIETLFITKSAELGKATVLTIEKNDSIKFQAYLFNNSQYSYSDMAIPIYPVCFKNKNLISNSDLTGNEFTVKNLWEDNIEFKIYSSNKNHYLINKDSGQKLDLPCKITLDHQESNIFQLLSR